MIIIGTLSTYKHPWWWLLGFYQCPSILDDYYWDLIHVQASSMILLIDQMFYFAFLKGEGWSSFLAIQLLTELLVKLLVGLVGWLFFCLPNSQLPSSTEIAFKVKAGRLIRFPHNSTSHRDSHPRQASCLCWASIFDSKAGVCKKMMDFEKLYSHWHWKKKVTAEDSTYTSSEVFLRHATFQVIPRIFWLSKIFLTFHNFSDFSKIFWLFFQEFSDFPRISWKNQEILDFSKKFVF